MSINNLTVDGEFRYIIQWFNEWSELQRDDFIPIMVDYITDTCDGASTDALADAAATTTTTTPTIIMNGLQSNMERSLNLNDKPMSLFQCRVKLFSQWNRRWPQDFKDKLQQKITEIDNKVGERIKETMTMKHNGCGSLTNGYAGTNDDDDEVHHYECNNDDVVTKQDERHHYPPAQSSQNESPDKEEQQQQQQQQNEIIVVTNAVTLNDPMREVLSNETSVDDIEPNEEQPPAPQQQQVNINRAAEADNDNVAHAYSAGINEDFSNNSSSHAQEPVEQVEQMRNLQINEDGHEDVTTSQPAAAAAPVAAQSLPQQHTTTPVTVTVSTIAQSMATNAEVPLVA